jgi:AcrR family transcriptional regulator
VSRHFWTVKSRLGTVSAVTRALTPKGSATRQRIIDGAATLVRRQGVELTGLDGIRAETATSKSQLFHYFPGGRAELLYAVAEHESAQVIADQQPYLDGLGAAPTWTRWRDVVVRKYRDQGRECPLSALTTQLGPTDPRIRPLVAALLEDWHGRIADGVRRRWLTPPLNPTDPMDTAATILAAIQGGVVLMLSTGRIAYLETALDAAIAPLAAEAHSTVDNPNRHSSPPVVGISSPPPTRRSDAS